MRDDSAARIEAQEYYVLRFEKARNFRLSGQRERRGKKRGNDWLKPWQRNLTPTEAELRRHERPPSRTPEAEHARYLRRREGA